MHVKKAVSDAVYLRGVYERMHADARPTNIIAIGNHVLQYDYVPGAPCRSLRAIHATAEARVWQEWLTPQRIDVKAYIDYMNAIHHTHIWNRLRFLPLTPVHCCHGDMTVENTVLTLDERVVFIDPGFDRGLPCRELDEAKLLQSYDGWESVKRGWQPLECFELPFKVTEVHHVLRLSHYYRMLRHQTGDARRFAERKIDEITNLLR